MKDVNGNVITGVAEQTQRWKSHFETIVNIEAPNNLADIPVSDDNLEINTDAICCRSEESSQLNVVRESTGS